MSFDIDSAIFIGFLAINLVFGLLSSRGVKNIKEYAIGDRNFSTATIAATIVATWISGGIFFTIVSESYSNGLYFMWAGAGDAICLLVVGYFFAPRLAEFLGKISIAEAMGELYGKPVRIITSIAGFIGVSGVIAMQLKISGLLFEYCFDAPSAYGVIIGGVIVTLYSTLGGIKSVTFTDVIQFFTFGTIIPIITLFILSTVDSMDIVINTLSNNEVFDYQEVFDFTKPKAFYYLFLFLFFAVPAFNPAIFQRIAMAKNTNQIRQSFIIAGFTCLFLMIMIDWIGILLLSTHPDLPPNEVVKHLIFDYSYVGLKGLILAGIMAMLMSTADSYINSTSVLVVHDFCKPLGINIIKNELNFSRLASLLIGIFSITLSLYSSSLLQLALTTYSFYMPIVTVPFMMSLLGFRSSGKSVLIGMGAGFLTVISWEIFFKNVGIDGLVPGMGANLIFLFGSHYLLKQPGGWVGIKDVAPLVALRRERKLRLEKLLPSIKSFNLVNICRNNCPKEDGLIAILGLFVMVSGLSSAYTLAKEYQVQYAQLLGIFYPITFCSSAILMTYPLWLDSQKNANIIGIFWNVIMFSVLICFGFFMVLISQFSEIQLVAFMVNVMVISSFTKWKWSIFNIVSGVIIVSFCYANYIIVDENNSFSLSQFKIAHLLLLVICSLFLKQKQEQHELTELKADHLGEQIHDMYKELEKSLELKNEFLRNLPHEVHTPIMGITSLGQVLFENYDHFTDEQKRRSLEEIAKNSERLSSLVNNMIGVSKLMSLKYILNKKQINLSYLVYERLDYCKKLYLTGKKLEFVRDIESDVLINCDEHYITSTLDNLIINAINYSDEGTIITKLKANQNLVEFNITDEGIGIPEEELHSIFGAFVVSSKTRTLAGGRGIGLALCKNVVEAHKGEIWARCNQDKGVTLSFTIPIG